MHFAEAEQKYRELEDQLLSGALESEEFVAQVAQLRVTDGEGRHWMLSARTGRWLLHDGQQWVLAEPPRDKVGPEEVPPDVEEIPIIPEAPADAPETAPPERIDSRPIASRLLLLGFAALVLVGCLVGGGVTAWVLVLRDLGEPTSIPVEPTAVGLVVTYTPRPATPTFTLTPSPTPSRIPPRRTHPSPSPPCLPHARPGSHRQRLPLAPQSSAPQWPRIRRRQPPSWWHPLPLARPPISSSGVTRYSRLPSALVSPPRPWLKPTALPIRP